MWLGVAKLTESLRFILAFVLLYWVYYERIMYAEESFLISNFIFSFKNYTGIRASKIMPPKIKKPVNSVFTGFSAEKEGFEPPEV